jgi:hypothetical protein
MRNKLIIILICMMTLMSSCRYFQDGADTAFKEFKPSALLKKYEYFKDMSAQLDKKMADLGVYKTRLTDLKEQYKGVSRKDWARDDREQYSVWQSEEAGVKASYNGLAAEYNAAMVKFNYSFCNVGELPQGATVPLPREYKPYIDN